jgi:chemosensory pili system protein ChpA (sensor histidine kinase/response regulator)
MDHVQNISFIEEAEQKLRIIRSGFLVCLQEGRFAELNLPGELAALRESATRLNFASVVTVLEAVERESLMLFSPGKVLTDAKIRGILDLISHAEAEVIKLRFSQDETNVLDFVERSFDILQLSPLDQPEPAAAEQVEEDEFEPDAEMLEIFSMEAEDLLSNIESNLEILSATPADREALWEIRRHAHTFKGAAGIIGLKKPSKLAHRIEDLLDHLAQSDVVPAPRVLELITSATDCLRVITKGEASPETTAKTDEVYNAFDELMSALSSGAVTDEAPPAVTVETHQDEPIASAVAASPSDDAAAVRRPIVRVSIARLDNLVRVVRDLAVSRSAVEQRLSDFEAQLESLGKTARRLQAANAKIENDFEASMLGPYSPAFFSRPRTSYGDVVGFSSEPTEGEEFDALEFDRYTDFHESSRDLSEAIQECFAIGTSLEALRSSLETVIDDQRRLIEETQERVMQIRLIRFESIATRLQRAVRVTCEEEQKKAEIVIENQDVELDTDVLDSLVEPLMHLIRNAVVHGIEPPDMRRLLGKPETGRITVRIANQETHIELKVSDDGRGIAGTTLKERAIEAGLLAESDADHLDSSGLISLISLPGLTTAEKLTMSAGRGVGMGIVKESVEARKGTLSVETSLQQGTAFTIRVPLAFAFAQVLLVRSGSDLAAILLKTVTRILDLSPSDLSDDGSGPAVTIGSIRFPVRYLADHFSTKRSPANESTDALLIETGSTRFALIVDEILRNEEIAIKPLGRPLDRIASLLGAAVLGNGQIVPVLDVSQLEKTQPHMHFDSKLPEVNETPPFVLVVDDSPSVRHITSKTITAAGWTVVTAKDGVEALEILAKPEKPAVILTDVEMPRLDGYELISAVKQDPGLRHIPVVFITSRVSEKHRERAAELGISEYVTKPFVEAELLSTIERLAVQPAVELAI